MLFSKNIYAVTHSLTKLVIGAGLLLLFSASQAPAQSGVPDLTDTVWQWVGEDASFVLTFKQGNPEPNGLVAILKGWGESSLELRGEYSKDSPRPRLHLTGSYEGQKASLDLELDSGDHEQKPFLQGEFSVGSPVFSIFAVCDERCPDFDLKKEASNGSAIHAMTDMVGEWQDVSGDIGFKEYWSIKSINGQLQISGKFIKGEEVIGSFRGEEAIFDTNKGVLSFRQVFDQKPDEKWLDSNEIEVTAQSDTLKFRVRGVEAILTRAPGSKK
jgi:hypothetical protein